MEPTEHSALLQPCIRTITSSQEGKGVTRHGDFAPEPDGIAAGSKGIVTYNAA